MDVQDFQRAVHRTSVEKGFYDFRNDLDTADMIVEALAESTEVVPTVNELETLRRILADYRKLQLERKLLLAIGELVEAHAELRAGHSPSEIYYSPENPEKPEGFGIEIADAHIRLFDLEEAHGIDAKANMRLKHSYNGTRPHKHGKQF